MRGQAVSATTWAKLAFALSAISLAVSLAGVTPVEAVKSVKRSLFANNAGAVDGISASRTPKPGRLLALDAQGRFPGSVLPGAGAAGARGPRGPEGPTGPRGPASAFYTHSPEGVQMIRAKNAYATVSKLERLPAGKWVLMYSLNAVWWDASAVVLACRLMTDGQEVNRKEVIVGSDGATRAMVVSGSVAVERAQTFTVTTECATSDAVLPESRDAVGVGRRDLTAIKVEELTIQ